LTFVKKDLKIQPPPNPRTLCVASSIFISNGKHVFECIGDTIKKSFLKTQDLFNGRTVVICIDSDGNIVLQSSKCQNLERKLEGMFMDDKKINIEYIDPKKLADGAINIDQPWPRKWISKKEAKEIYPTPAQP